MPIISSEALKLNLCEKCNTDFYQKENVPTYKNGYINCYKKIDGYYWKFEKRMIFCFDSWCIMMLRIHYLKSLMNHVKNAK